VSIQIARAVAALSVVLFHSHFAVAAFETKTAIPFFTAHGSFGVDLFFAISGFIIAHISRDGRFVLGSYLLKRFFRIYPIYWAFVTLSMVAYFKYGYRLGGNEYTAGTLIKSIFIWPMKDQPWYAVGWTLEHEVIFYIIAGIVLSFAGLRTLIAILGTAGVIGIVFHSVLPSFDVTQNFWDWHLVDPSMILFCAGVAVYAYQAMLARLGVTVPLLTFVVSITATIAAIDSKLPPLPQLGTVLIGFSSAALIVTLLNLERLGAINSRALRFLQALRFLIIIGDASFSLYLVHWVIVLEAGRGRWKLLLGLPEWASEPWRWSVVALCVAVSVVMHRCFEKPIISFGHRVAKKKWGLPAPAALLRGFL
jgi:peptidoglycan/LPS O-acetylase OafA/YrhL